MKGSLPFQEQRPISVCDWKASDSCRACPRRVALPFVLGPQSPINKTKIRTHSPWMVRNGLVASQPMLADMRHQLQPAALALFGGENSPAFWMVVPRTDRLSATRLSLVIFKAYKSSLIVKERAGHYSSIIEPDVSGKRGYEVCYVA